MKDDGIPPGFEEGEDNLDLIYWCKECKKRIDLQYGDPGDLDVNDIKRYIEKEHQCPNCNTILFAWWMPVSKEQQKQRKLGGILIFSGLSVLWYLSVFEIAPLVILLSLSLIGLTVY